MPKKAFLVGFAPRTRIVVDVPEGYNPAEDGDVTDRIIRQAREKMLSDARNYLSDDNCDLVTEDDECPYGTFKDDDDDNPEALLKDIFSKYGPIVTEDDFKTVPVLMFPFEEESGLMSLTSLYRTSDGKVLFRWTAGGCHRVETLDEMDSDRRDYIIKELKNLL